MYIGETHIAAAEAVSKPLMIETEEMKNRGMQIVRLADVFD